jgi:thiol-disulfide isomerase/thioredoxin
MLKVAGQARKFEFDLAALRFSGDASSAGSNDAALECKKTTFPMPNWSLKDINPASATHDETLNLNSHFKLKRVVVLNGAGWCASCVSQTKSMEKLRAQLAAQGRNDVAFVTINSADAVQDQAAITAGVQVAVVQGTGSSGWQTMQRPTGKPGEKNDGFIFDYNGKLLGFFEGAGTIQMGVWEEWMAKNVGLAKDAGAGFSCKAGGAPGQFAQSCSQADSGL